MTAVLETRGRPPATADGKCVACKVPFRPKNVSIAEAPGTKHHRSRGLCGTCWERRANTGAVPISINETIAGLEWFIRDRRRRGIPPEGLGAEDILPEQHVQQ